MVPFLAFVAAAVLSFCDAIDTPTFGPHKAAWAMCALAVGLALGLWPAASWWPRRTPPAG